MSNSKSFRNIYFLFFLVLYLEMAWNLPFRPFSLISVVHAAGRWLYGCSIALISLICLNQQFLKSPRRFVQMRLLGPRLGVSDWEALRWGQCPGDANADGPWITPWDPLAYRLSIKPSKVSLVLQWLENRFPPHWFDVQNLKLSFRSSKHPARNFCLIKTFPLNLISFTNTS